jgi:hypothetical protein
MDASLKQRSDEISLTKKLETTPGLSMTGYSDFSNFHKRFITLMITKLEIPAGSIGNLDTVSDGLIIPAQTLSALWVEFWTESDLADYGNVAAITADENLPAVIPHLRYVPLPRDVAQTVTELQLWTSNRPDFADALSQFANAPPRTPSNLDDAFATASDGDETPRPLSSPALRRTTAAYDHLLRSIGETRAALKTTTQRATASDADVEALDEQREALGLKLSQQKVELETMGLAVAKARAVAAENGTEEPAPAVRPPVLLESVQRLRRRDLSSGRSAAAVFDPFMPQRSLTRPPAPLLTMLRATAAATPRAVVPQGASGGGFTARADSAKAERDQTEATRERNAATAAIHMYESTFPRLLTQVFHDGKLPTTEGLPLALLQTIRTAIERQVTIVSAVREVAQRGLAEGSPQASTLVVDLSEAALDATLAATARTSPITIQPLALVYKLVAFGQLAVLRLQQSFSPVPSRYVKALFDTLKGASLVDPCDNTKLIFAPTSDGVIKALADVDWRQQPFDVNAATRALLHVVCAAVDCKFQARDAAGDVLDWTLESQDCASTLSLKGAMPFERPELDKCVAMLRRFAEVQTRLFAVLQTTSAASSFGETAQVNFALEDDIDVDHTGEVFYLDTDGKVNGDRVMCSAPGCRHHRPSHTAICLACGLVDPSTAVVCIRCNLPTAMLRADGSRAQFCQRRSHGCPGLISEARTTISDQDRENGKLASRAWVERGRGQGRGGGKTAYKGRGGSGKGKGKGTHTADN